MTKLLKVLLGLFILFDIVVVFIFFGPKSTTSPAAKPLAKKCAVVDEKYCSTVIVAGNIKIKNTTVALFNLPKGTKIYSPINGQLNFSIAKKLENLPYHVVSGVDGVSYYLVFEPESIPKSRKVKAGEVIGIATGKNYAFMKNRTLAVSATKGQKFARSEFDALFK